MLISSPLGGSFFQGAFGDFGAAKKKVAKKTAKPAAKKVVAKKATAAGKTAAVAKAAITSGGPAVYKRLQAALVLLGRTAKDTVLASIKIDGAPGAKTADAVNRAFTKHIGPGQAAAQYRTGKMPLDYIKNVANTLSTMIEAEVTRRGGTVVPAATVAAGTAKYNATVKAAAAAAKKAAAAKLKADKLAAQKAAKAAAAKAKADKATAAKARAASARAKAAAAKTKAVALKVTNPAAAAAAASEAAAAESEAVQETAVAQTLTREAVADATEAQKAAVEQEAADTEVQATSVAAKVAAAAAPALDVLTRDEGEGGGSTSTALVPTSASPDILTVATESTLARYKWPLIAAGAVGLIGLAFLTFKKPTTPSKALAPARK